MLKALREASQQLPAIPKAIRHQHKVCPLRLCRAACDDPWQMCVMSTKPQGKKSTACRTYKCKDYLITFDSVANIKLPFKFCALRSKSLLDLLEALRRLLQRQGQSVVSGLSDAYRRNGDEQAVIQSDSELRIARCIKVFVSSRSCAH